MLHVADLAVGYGQEPVVEGVSLDVGAGKFVSLVGPSGSGKTSILRAVNGLLTTRAGQIELNGNAESLGFLFQDDALLPWRSARDNVALGLRIRNVSRSAAHSRSRRLARGASASTAWATAFRMSCRAVKESASPSRRSSP